MAVKFKKEFKEEIVFEDLLPELCFSSSGVFLPSSNQQKILFQTVNVRRVDLKIIKVFESNLGQFLHMETLRGKKDRRESFDYNINHTGVNVIKRELNILLYKQQHEVQTKYFVVQASKFCQNFQGKNN